MSITIILHLEKNTSMVSVVIEIKTKMLVGVHNTVIARAYCNTVVLTGDLQSVLNSGVSVTVERL